MVLRQKRILKNSKIQNVQTIGIKFYLIKTENFHYSKDSLQSEKTSHELEKGI